MSHFDPGGTLREDQIMAVARTMARARLPHSELIIIMLNLMAHADGPDSAIAELHSLSRELDLSSALGAKVNIALVAHEVPLDVPSDEVRCEAIARLMVDDGLSPVDVIEIVANGMLTLFPASTVRDHVAALASPKRIRPDLQTQLARFMAARSGGVSAPPGRTH